MKHLSLQQLWMLAAEPIAQDSQEAQHLKNCPECMDAVRWFANDQVSHIQNHYEPEAISAIYTDR